MSKKKCNHLRLNTSALLVTGAAASQGASAGAAGGGRTAECVHPAAEGGRPGSDAGGGAAEDSARAGQVKIVLVMCFFLIISLLLSPYSETLCSLTTIFKGHRV